MRVAFFYGVDVWGLLVFRFSPWRKASDKMVLKGFRGFVKRFELKRGSNQCVKPGKHLLHGISLGEMRK